MLDQLLNLVQQNAGDAIVNNPNVPNEKNQAAISETAHSIFDGLKNQLSGGNLSSVLAMFSGQGDPANNPAASAINNNVANSLSEKLGLNSAQAQSVSSSLVPQVLSSLVNKTNDPNDSSFDLNGIFSSLTGGKSSGVDMTALLDKFKGSDGKLGLDDVTSLFNSSDENQQGGLLDKLKGLFS